jgi:hypothetical protein
MRLPWLGGLFGGEFGGDFFFGGGGTDLGLVEGYEIRLNWGGSILGENMGQI